MAVDHDTTTPIQQVKVNGTQSQPNDRSTNTSPRNARPRRPNYNEIHAKPLPVDVYPLPAFLPHNPISIVRIAVSLLSHSFFPPKSHIVVHKAYFSSETQSIHVTDAASIRALWEQGFWGKGSLSRSEPQWLAGEKKKRGIEAGKTSAEVTQNRREERKQFKLERARAQREAIEQQLKEEGQLDPDGSLEELVEKGQATESPRGTIYTPDAEHVVTVSGDLITSEINKSVAQDTPSWSTSDAATPRIDYIQDQEHLQLTAEEGFYLSYGLGTLSVVTDCVGSDKGISHTSYSTWQLLRLYALHADSPLPEAAMSQLQNAFHQRQMGHDASRWTSSVPTIEPDNAFVLRYVVFHHFRSLGWVVRPGIKFAVDYLLYLRGPAFHHAEFAIMIVPSYSDRYWTQTGADKAGIEKRKEGQGKKDWWWLHRVNRVQSSVFKTLVLAYVEIPPPWDRHTDGQIGDVLKKYTVREVVIRRWSPNRNRD
ncbi:hypothetical protein BDU57DRAFT_511388 [Ampelomyces quisqualis]|uniref:tRNA-splicing endonuclease subunit Sen2 n=1 Tax=Ampelomyces quisqualis TaxID=50730 RepID=A0A6A5QXV4_AMPQU|nr:hypothetical protein BDU57DRAFT_511388 [Ampelomyces quisqualis]